MYDLQIVIGADGTAASDRPGQYRDSNVVKIVHAYADIPIYVPGVGVNQSFKYLRYLTGWGIGRRSREIQKAYREVQLPSVPGVAVPKVGVIGVCWSRGHLSLLEAIQDAEIEVDALVIFDAVSSLGDPIVLSLLDKLYPKEIPKTVKKCLHLVALHENDLGYREKLFPAVDGVLEQIATEGDHSEIGRGPLPLELSELFLGRRGFRRRQQLSHAPGWGTVRRKLVQDLQDYQTWLKNQQS